MHRWTTHGKKRRSALPAEAGVATVKGRHDNYGAEASPNPNAREALLEGGAEFLARRRCSWNSTRTPSAARKLSM